jgi:phosphatidylglycerol:prolipoprotein diacylglycerol transferase
MHLIANTSHWVHDLSPFLFKFPEAIPLIGGHGVRYYGVAYMMGFVAGYLLLVAYFKQGRSPYSPTKVSDLLTFFVIGVLAGGRLGYIFLYDIGSFLSNPLVVFQVWQGGMSSHGGMIGVTIAGLLFAHWNKQSKFQLADLVALTAAPGLFFGRLANFINGELWGHPSSVPWAVKFPLANPHVPAEELLPRHPSQLYEALGEGLLLFIYIQLRFYGKLGPQPKNGQLIGEFLVFYSVARIVCEIFREPDASLLAGIPRGQFYSIGTLIAGVVVVIIARKLASSPKEAVS